MTNTIIPPQLYNKKLSEYGRVIVAQTYREYQLAIYFLTNSEKSGFAWLHDKEWCGVNKGFIKEEYYDD